MENSPSDATETVDLPAHLVDRIEDRLADTRFESVDAYATVALELLLREVEDAPVETPGQDEATAVAGDGGPVDGDPVDRDEAVKRRLDSLGYL